MLRRAAEVVGRLQPSQRRDPGRRLRPRRRLDFLGRGIRRAGDRRHLCAVSHGVGDALRDAGGVGGRSAALCDAAEVPGENRFDAAVAIDSSGYLPRRDWLNRTASLLEAGRFGLHHRLFSRRPQIRGFVQQPLAYSDRHDRRIFRGGARKRIEDGIGRRRHGPHRALLDDDARAHRRWSSRPPMSAETAARYSASRKAHALVRDGLADGGLRYAMISFTKSRERQLRAQPSSPRSRYPS